MNKIIAFLSLGLLWLGSAQAHQPSTSYLTIDASEEFVSGSWDIPLIDLQLVLNLDADNDRSISWGEILSTQQELSFLASRQIKLITNGKACDLKLQAPLANQIHGDGFLHLPWTSSCQAASPLSLNYQLFSTLNIGHRALLNLKTADSNQSYVVRPDEENYKLGAPGFVSYFYEGVIHIWIGYDHLLFLLLLLLPLAAASWRKTLQRSLILITAFTAAHSLSLIIVTLWNLALPVQLVEVSISLSIVAAAALLVWKPNHQASTLLALALGLLHGLGFANVLRELLANGDNLAIHLLGFNLGVEVGQLCIAAIIIPLLILAHQRFNYAVVVRVLALISLAIACYWTIERL